MGSMTIRKTERLSNNHWRLVYLRDHPDWRGEAVVVAREGERTSVLIPELGMETRVRIKSAPELNQSVKLKPREVDLADLTCYFRIL
jgi:exoribonuclease-2